MVLTFRWMLVPALPVVGLLLGLWLKPAMKPRWERTLDSTNMCAGMLVDGKEACLLTYGRVHFENNIQTHQLVTGLSLANGEELFTRKIPARSFSQAYMVPGTTLAVCSTYDSPDCISIYRWKAEQEVYRLKSGVPIPLVLSATIENDVLAVVVSGGETNDIYFWQLGTNQQPICIQVNKVNLKEPAIQMSSNGAWVINRYTDIVTKMADPGLPGYSENHVEVIDTKLGKKVQTLSGDIGYVYWLPNEDAFMALHHATEQHWQKYVRKNDSFVPSGSAIFTPRMGYVMLQSPGPSIVLVSSNEFDPLRNKVKSYLGKSGEELLKTIWKQAMLLDVYRGSNGELVESLAIPDFGPLNVFDFYNGGKAIYLDPNGHGLIVQELHHVAYWEFSPASRWYPWIGLCLGVILSILVARWNLRRETPAQSLSPKE